MAKGGKTLPGTMGTYNDQKRKLSKKKKGSEHDVQKVRALAATIAKIEAVHLASDQKRYLWLLRRGLCTQAEANGTYYLLIDPKDIPEECPSDPQINQRT